MYAYSAILNALLLRGRTGEGSRIDVSMLESMVEWMGYPCITPLTARRRRCAQARPATIYPYGPFPVGGRGHHHAGPAERARVARVLRPGAAPKPNWPRIRASCPTRRHRQSRGAAHALIVGAFAGLDIDQVTQRLEDAQIANARVNDMAGVWAHPQLQARQRWRGVGSPAGALPALLPPATNSAYAPRMDPVPAVGDRRGAGIIGVRARRVARLHAAEVV